MSTESEEEEEAKTGGLKPGSTIGNSDSEQEANIQQSGAPATAAKVNYYIPGLNPSNTASSSTGASVLPPHLQELAETTDAVAKTRLDYGAIEIVAQRSIAQQESKITEEIKNRVVEPPKPVENYRKSTPCNSVCKETEKPERVSFCERCQLRVYDFSKMEQPEVEDLIFKMEGRRNVLLFKRPDGKFLTNDCPVGIKSKQMVIVTGVVAVLLVVGFIYGLTMQPPPTARKVTATEELPSAQKADRKSSGAGWSNGWQEVSVHSKQPAAATSSPAVGQTKVPVPAALAPEQAAGSAQNLQGSVSTPQATPPTGDRQHSNK